MILNPEQEMAANHFDGPALVTACPGSGKTRTVVERTSRLIEKGVAPKSIMCITFTNKAAEEMRERVEKNVGVEVAKKIWISTFHRLGCYILRKQGHFIGYAPGMTICMPDDQIDLVSQCARQLGHELTKPVVKKIAWQVNDSRENLETDAEFEDRLVDFGRAIQGESVMTEDAPYYIGKEYLDRLKASNQIDFTGMLSETARLLRENPETLAKMHSFFKYFQIDEVQDTNLAQFKIMEMLAQGSRNIMAVGDLDQSIYGWRGARAENIQDYLDLYKDAKIIKLGKNYRSTPQIIKVADKLIRHNEGRIAADFSTDNPNGPPVTCKMVETSDHEAKWVAETIRNLIQQKTFAKKDIAIFYRLNTMSRALEMAMMHYGMSYELIGDLSFFDRKEVKDTLSMLKFFANPKDGISFHRMCNKPRRQLGDSAVGKIENYAKANTGGNILEALKDIGKIVKAEGVQDGAIEILRAYESVPADATPAEAMAKLVKGLKYEEFLASEAEDPSELDTRKANIQELLNSSAEFHAKGGGGVVDYLESVSLNTKIEKDQEEDAVQMMSAHASKGLEFPVVFIVGAEQGIMPHSRATMEREGGLEEERRLMYVAATRAEKILCISYCKRRAKAGFGTKGKISYQVCEPSQFLHEMGLVKKVEKQQSRILREDQYI